MWFKTSPNKSRQDRLNVLELLRRYPVPAIALSGLLIGTVITWGLARENIGDFIWYATLIVGGVPLVYKTVRGVARKEFAADIVATLAIIAAILMDQAFAGVIIVLMQSGGEALEDYGLGRASSSLDELLSRAPRIANRKKDDSIEEVDAKEVKVGDIIVVRPGDLVPVDGVVTSENAEIDESSLTGEPLPVGKKPGDHVLSGSVNVGNTFTMRTERISEESQYAKIIEIVKKAQLEKPKIQRLADRYATWFTPFTLVVAAVGWMITRDPTTILSVLVVATPCPLILATPIAVIGAVNKSAKEGIIVKSGAAVEQVGMTRVVVFDKTGTMTYGSPLVERFIPLDGWSRDELLFKAASVEQLSSHPVAISLHHFGEEELGKLGLPTNFREVAGRGVEADLNGEHLVIGSQGFCQERLGIGFEELSRELRKKFQTHGKLISFIIVNGKPAGLVVFSDRVRPGVPAMMLRLRELGVEETIMITGDNAENAKVVAEEAGVGRVEANLLPAQKVAIVQKLREKHGSVIMVGDGINDAPALASATVGVAMGAHGTGISAEAADIVLLVDDVTKVVDSISIGQTMLRIAKQSIFFGLGASLIFMMFASFGLIPPAAGALLQELLDTSVVLNALRVR